MRSSLSFGRILGLAVLSACAACGGGKAKDQASARILANPYNSKVHGNVYHSRWRDLELEFSTRTWRVESGEYALHLVAKDKYSQVLLGSKFLLWRAGGLEDAANKQLERLGLRDVQILSKEPVRIQNLEALVVTAKGQFLVDRSRELRIDRRVRLLIARTARRRIWMAYVSTEEAFPAHLPSVAELEQKLRILSQATPGNVNSSGGKDARLDVAIGEGAGARQP